MCFQHQSFLFSCGSELCIKGSSEIDSWTSFGNKIKCELSKQTAIPSITGLEQLLPNIKGNDMNGAKDFVLLMCQRSLGVKR